MVRTSDGTAPERAYDGQRAGHDPRERTDEEGRTSAAGSGEADR